MTNKVGRYSVFSVCYLIETKIPAKIMIRSDDFCDYSFNKLNNLSFISIFKFHYEDDLYWIAYYVGVYRVLYTVCLFV